jgi:hypothetical protein
MKYTLPILFSFILASCGMEVSQPYYGGASYGGTYSSENSTTSGAYVPGVGGAQRDSEGNQIDQGQNQDQGSNEGANQGSGNQNSGNQGSNQGSGVVSGPGTGSGSGSSDNDNNAGSGGNNDNADSGDNDNNVGSGGNDDNSDSGDNGDTPLNPNPPNTPPNTQGCPNEAGGLSVGQLIPEMTMQDTDGNTVSIRQDCAKVGVFYGIGGNCGLCKNIARTAVTNLSTQHAGDDLAVYVVITAQESAASAPTMSYCQQKKNDWQLQNVKVLCDTQQNFARTYSPPYINSAGLWVVHDQGLVSKIQKNNTDGNWANTNVVPLLQ